MGADHTVEMSDSEIEAFVGRRGTAVLSLARGNTPYSIPVSYGYAPGDEAFYFRLGFRPDSEKHEFVDDSAPARLVRYENTDDEWKSIVAAGELHTVTDTEITADVATALQHAELPLLSAWDEPIEDIEFDIYRLTVDRLTGRTGPGDFSDEFGQRER